MKNLIKIFLLLVFYLIGQFSYDTFYSLTLKSIRFLNEDKISFYGKLWDFVGNLTFGLTFLILPISNYFLLKIIKLKRQTTYIAIFFLTELISLCLTFLLVSYFYGQFLIRQIQLGRILCPNNKNAIHLHQVNIFIVLLLTIIFGLSLTFAIYKLVTKKVNVD
jgi:hypothetical protein